MKFQSSITFMMVVVLFVTTVFADEEPKDDSDKVEANSFPLSQGNYNSDVLVPEGFGKDGKSDLEESVSALAPGQEDELEDKDGKTTCYWPYVYGGWGRCCYYTHPYYYNGYCNKCRYGYTYSNGGCCPNSHPLYIPSANKCCPSGYPYYYSGLCHRCPSGYPNYYNGRCYANCSFGCFRNGYCSIFYCLGR